MAFGTSIKLGNIKENWLFQFGYFNGDAQGNGDGGFTAVTQANGNPNLINNGSNINDSQTDIDVDDGTVFTVGDHIKVDNEIMKVVSISSNELTVAREAMRTTAATHNDNTQVYWQNFFPISFADVKYSDVYYYGVILNNPSIRESIDLAKSTAKTGNVKVTIADFDYQGSKISKELFGSTKQYINQEVKILSQINEDTPNQIGSYRLVDISTDGFKLNLSLTAHRPWDFISFPQDKASFKNIYLPIVYGAYAPNASRQNSQDYCNNKELFPVVKYGRGGQASGFVHESLNGSSGNEGRPHIYEESLDAFIPVTAAAGSSSYEDSSGTFAGGNIIGSDTRLFRGFKCKPTGVHADNNWGTNADRAFNNSGADDTSNYAEEIREVNTTSSATDSLVLACPEISGKITALEIIVRASLTTASTGTINYTSTLLNKTLGRSDVIISSRTSDGTTGPSDSTKFDMTSSITNGEMPSTVQIDMVTQRITGSGTVIATGRVYDVRLFVKADNDFGDDPVGAKQTTQETQLYCGADGLVDNGWNSSAAITEIHEVHRDLLSRFAGLSDTDPTGWSDLESSKDWTIRYWQHEPIELEKSLERLQYEGGFIYVPSSNKYIHIKDSYSTTASSNILSKSDISGISIKLTPFSQLLTKMDVNYEKHPLEDGYVITQNCTNSTSRAKYNIKSAENKKNVNLDMYIAPTVPSTPSSNPNDDFYTYYDNIFGSVKLIVDCTVVNPEYYALELGDVIEFDENNMFPATPMGHNSATWNGLKMMIVSMSRSVGTLKITAREI